MMTDSAIAVIILTWNNYQLTLDCLRSLAAQTAPHLIYVVDNASTDGTPERIRAGFPSAQMIVNSENLGFAAGNNVGLRAAFAEGADAALVLNNDTTLDPSAIAHLRDSAQMHPDAGVLSPVILYARPPHRVWFAGAIANPWTGRIYHQYEDARYEKVPQETREIERTTGCAMFITRACFELIGGFDESLFMYFEDVEYSLRVCDAGFSLILVPQAMIYHHVSASSRGTKPANAVYYGVRNGIETMERMRPLPRPAAAFRRFLMVAAMLLYIAKPPRALTRVHDVLAGYRDARRHRRGPRQSAPTGSPYGLNPDTRGAHMRMLGLIPLTQRVLDVGCASGYLAQILQGRGYRVTGVEIDPDAARRARAFCDEVFEISAEDLDLIPSDRGQFDVVLFGDVLEHLAHPEKALHGVHRLLAPDGVVILSLPNIVFFTARLSILLGRFDYARDGLFDRTHLHFFTSKSAEAMIKACGFEIVVHDVTQASPISRIGTILRRRNLTEATITRFVDRCDLWVARHMQGIFGLQQLFILRSADNASTLYLRQADVNGAHLAEPEPVETP